jgi:hypothetical protein
MNVSIIPIGRCYLRDVVRVERANGAVLGFYRSTGNNSGKPGVWFPFDGIKLVAGFGAWFDKQRYSPMLPSAHPLCRFGAAENRAISDEIARMEFLPFETVSPGALNDRLGYYGHDPIMLAVWPDKSHLNAVLERDHQRYLERKSVALGA